MNRPRVCLVIPALNESASLPRVLQAVPRAVIDEIIVADNGSTDATAEMAVTHGARVVSELRRGYGSACLAGVAAADHPDIIVFMDGDWSDDPAEIPSLLAPLLDGTADIVIGSRTLGRPEKGALLPQARWGNALAGLLIRLLFKRKVTDLGPFRALTARAWDIIRPDDRAYGFPVQTQVRALARGLRVAEVPVGYRRRIGRSKISGTVRGVIMAGHGILTTIVKEYLRRGDAAAWPPETTSGEG
jgi:glycosyltransferase involved in cell wall biosynthesis